MTIDNEKNRAFWDAAARRSGSERIEYAGMLMEGREFEAIYRCEAEGEHLLRIFTPTPQTRVLEIGSGGGRWGYFFAARVKSYLGLDLSSEMVRLAEAERLRRGLSNVSFQCTDFLSFDTDAKYELVYFSGVLQYMDDATVVECVKKATTLLADGGVIISRDTVQGMSRVEKGGDYPVVYRTTSEYAALFSEAGYTMNHNELSYLARRFTGVASRLFATPFFSYRMAIGIRNVLCGIDALLGSPDFLKPRTLRNKPLEENVREHRFYRYSRQA